MAHWLLKSEPSTYSYDTLEKEGRTLWDGVRNYQARNFMKMMKKGDLCFFYHSGIKTPHVIGIAEVIEEYRPEENHPDFGFVTVAPLKRLNTPVTLSMIKAHPDLQNIHLIRQSRLSVMPISEKEWKTILALGTTTQ